MVTAYTRRNIVTRGTRTRTYKKTYPPVVTNVNHTRNYYASSVSTKGDHRKPTGFYWRKLISTAVSAVCVSTSSTSNYDQEYGIFGVYDQNTAPTYGKEWMTDYAYNEAVSNLGSKMRGDTDWSINFFQFRQLQESINRIKHPIMSYQAAVAKMRGGALDTSKELAALRLEWAYGIKPFIFDLYNTFAKVVDDVKSNGGLIHFRGRGSIREQFDDRRAKLTAFSVSDGIITTRVDRSVRCQIDIYVGADLNTIQKLGNHTSLNPATWVWENIPWSFVVDWFFNISNYIRGLETALLHSNRFVSGCRTDSVRQDESAGGGGKTVQIPSITYQVTGGSRTSWSYERTVLSNFPSPDRPRLHPEIGVWRALNAIALLLSIAPGSKKLRSWSSITSFKGK